MSWLYLAGQGGGLLGSKLLGFKTICAVEWEPYCQATILARQADGILEHFPVWDDIRTFDGRPWRGLVDVISAGFPCQPFSNAGRRQGEQDSRNMWPDTIRIIREVQPSWCLLENVAALAVNPYFGSILEDLENADYDPGRPQIIAAADVGAPHLRKRVWIIPHAKSIRAQGRLREPREGKPILREDGENRPMADADADEGGWPRRSRNIGKSWWGEFTDSGRWSAEPGLGRVAHGVAHRVDRLKAIGNGQVPAVVAAAWENIRSLK